MSFVLDCSVTLAWVYPDEITDSIRELFDTIAEDGCSVPMLWRLEVANSLTMSIRRGRITAGFRSDALRVLDLLPITVDVETGTRAWTTTLQLADRFGLTVYDATYLELAQRRAFPLASLDNDTSSAARILGVPLIGD